MSRPTKAQLRMLDAILEDKRRLEFIEEFSVSVGKSEEGWFACVHHPKRYGYSKGATATEAIDGVRAKVWEQITQEKANERWHKRFSASNHEHQKRLDDLRASRLRLAGNF